MSLAMIRPFKHPKTGVYWLRKVVPAPLRTAVGKRELIKSLGTKDPREAKGRAGPVGERFEAIIAAAQIGGDRLTQREIDAMCGEWYRAESATWGDDPGSFGDLDVYESLLHDQVEDTEDDADAEYAAIRLTPHDRNEARALLAARGYLADAGSVDRLGEALFRTKLTFAEALKRRQGGDWSPDPALARFPALAPRKAPEAAPQAITVDDLIVAWGAETGTLGKALYDRIRTGKLLTTFVGHTDAARITADDAVAWKEARLAAGRSVKTVANDIGELRPIWKWGRANRKLTFADNPFAGIAPRSRKHGRRVRGPYTEEEASRLLHAARGEADASLRWLPWALCFTGARLGELTQAVQEDVQRDGAELWFIHLHAEGEGRTLKTPHSERKVPLHPALITEGFLAHVQGLRTGSPLFPDLRPDTFGTLKGTATKKHGRWVRRTVGISDKTKDPAHAWRHRFEDQARRAGVPQNVTDGLMGHLNAANESEGYGRGHRFMPDVTAPWVAKMAAPNVPPGGPLHLRQGVPQRGRNTAAGSSGRRSAGM
jgi:integrase